MRPIHRYSAERLRGRTAVIHRQLLEFGEMRETLRFESRQNRAKSGRAVEQMAQEHAHRPCVRNVRRPVQTVCREQTDQVIGSVELFVNFRQKRRAERPVVHYSSANTHTDPPSGIGGTSPGNKRASVLTSPPASWPQPASTTMYCFPFTEKEVGGASAPELSGNSHSSLPVDASKAWNLRSAVPPLNTSPPPVASIDPQFGDRA